MRSSRIKMDFLPIRKGCRLSATMDLPLHRVLVNTSAWASCSVFSLEFYLEFLKRHGADPMLFRAGAPFDTRVTCEEPLESSVPGWVPYCPEYPVFHKTETNVWFYTDDAIRAGDAWREDPRVQALVDEMGLEAASGHRARLRYYYTPTDCTWSVVKMDGEGEYIRWEFPTDRIVSDLRSMALGKAVQDPHSYTKRILADETVTPEAIIGILTRRIASLETPW